LGNINACVKGMYGQELPARESPFEPELSYGSLGPAPFSQCSLGSANPVPGWTQGLPLVQQYQYQFERLLQEFCPPLGEHLRNENIHPSMYCSQVPPSYHLSCESDDSVFGTGRQKMVLERGTAPTLSRRTCSPRYGL
jgi:hypothetical protein